MIKSLTCSFFLRMSLVSDYCLSGLPPILNATSSRCLRSKPPPCLSVCFLTTDCHLSCSDEVALEGGCDANLVLSWMTEVGSSIYATPLIHDLNSDGQLDIIVPTFVHYLEVSNQGYKRHLCTHLSFMHGHGMRSSYLVAELLVSYSEQARKHNGVLLRRAYSSKGTQHLCGLSLAAMAHVTMSSHFCIPYIMVRSNLQEEE